MNSPRPNSVEVMRPTVMPAMRASSHLCILVVDDEPMIRMTAADLLADAGYDVVEAANADEALRLIEKQPRRFSHVFTDVQMPGKIDGLMLAHLVTTLYTEIMVVVTSADPCLQDEAIEQYYRFVPKPWTPIDVLNIVVPAHQDV
jgi:CheY-like chemotaxis protein